MRQRLAIVIALVATFLTMPISVLAANDAGTVSGTVRSSSGAPVAGADIVVSGPARRQTSTDAKGTFSLSLAPGLYRVQVSKSGYISASLDNLVVLDGSTQPVNVTLEQVDLSSLHTIATVTTRIGSSINTGSAQSSVVSAQEIQDLANPQVNAVLQRIPGANLERGGSAPNTSLSLGGAQPYETQTLLDGHPLSGGRYGTFFTQFFNSFMLHGIETETGPGNTTPFAGNAIGGTANFLTPGFTARPTAQLVTGIDSYGSQYTDFLTTGRFDRLSYVIGGGYNANNGPYQGSYGCVVTPASSKLDNKPGSTGIIQYCGDLSGTLWTKGEIAKLNYDFSPSTSFEIGYVGSQAGYYPQGSAYGQLAQGMTIVQCLPGGKECTNPSYQQYVGTQINGHIQYPGSNVFNDQPIFEGQFRTTIGNNTLLVRPYAGSILRDIDGGGESDYPNYYAATAANGCSTSSTNGYYECAQSPYTTFELDHLHGTTVSFIHPFGESELTATYDYHSDDTYAAAGNPDSVPFPTVVPNTLEKYNIFSITGDLAVARNTMLKVGAYDTNWSLSGEQAQVPTPGATPLLAPLTSSKNHFDPHVALIFQPVSGVSYRVAYGTSVNFPYAGLVSGIPYISLPSATAPDGTTLVEKNPLLTPETASEFSLGADKRFRNGSILSADLLDMQISNVIETLTTEINAPAYTYVNEPINAARLNNQMFTLTYSLTPRRGVGYYLTGSLQHSVVEGVPISFYSPTAYSQPANGVQQCGNICIPYLKGYGALNYTWSDHTFAELGADFEGKNNSYNQPPFVILDLGVRRPMTPTLEADISVENLLNTNNFNNLVLPNLGVAQVGESRNGYGSVVTPLLPAPPRTLRVGIRWHLNDGHL